MLDGTDTQLDPGPPPESPAVRSAGRRARMTTGDKVRFGLRGVGQTLITLGLVTLLFVVYEVWITNIFAHWRQEKVHTQLEQAWQDGIDPLALPGGNQSGIPIGEGIANIYIPRFGRDYHFTVVQGTDDASLSKGPGHYVGTALPGEVGNFGVAGHRVGKGEPFLNLDHLRPGDAVIIQTKTQWFVYRVIGNVDKGEAGLSWQDLNGVPGREIVDPSAGRVLAPWPDKPGSPAPPTYNRYMTMTTCHPKFTAAQRMIVHAQLDATLTTASIGPSQMPASIQALYSAPGL
jgi:sortase A